MTGDWLVRRATDGTLVQVAWGSPFLGDVPALGDYDGDGAPDLAVYRTLTGDWLIRRSTDGTLVQVPWGAPSLRDVPVTRRPGLH
jgi:hypothetical protein